MNQQDEGTRINYALRKHLESTFREELLPDDFTSYASAIHVEMSLRRGRRSTIELSRRRNLHAFSEEDLQSQIPIPLTISTEDDNLRRPGDSDSGIVIVHDLPLDFDVLVTIGDETFLKKKTELHRIWIPCDYSVLKISPTVLRGNNHIKIDVIEQKSKYDPF